MEVMCNRLDRSYFKYQKEYEDKALEILRSGWYVLGKEVCKFEEEFADYLGAKYCVGVASGLDALWIGLKVLGIGKGDEVIVQANTYIASVMGITINGATPVFVEPNEYNNIDVDKIEERITEKTKAILVVHLYGQASKMDKIMRLAEKYNLEVIEDCAQSHGATYNNRMTGTFGKIGCFSFYPSKNLGAFGEGGAIVTDSEELAETVRIFRNYGSEKRYYNKLIGTNSRLDELQAGLLRIKLKHLSEYNAERCEICERYMNGIDNVYIQKPYVQAGASTVWHQFVIRSEFRDELQRYLEENGIKTIIHYPIPPHLAEAYRYLDYKEGDFPITEAYANSVLSLPLYNGLTDEEQNYVIDILNKFKPNCE